MRSHFICFLLAEQLAYAAEHIAGFVKIEFGLYSVRQLVELLIRQVYAELGLKRLNRFPGEACEQLLVRPYLFGKLFRLAYKPVKAEVLKVHCITPLPLQSGPQARSCARCLCR